MKFTIFTPTFNRKELLEKLYKSLQKQTYKDFEWLIVDDGSSLHTEPQIGSRPQIRVNAVRQVGVRITSCIDQSCDAH